MKLCRFLPPELTAGDSGNPMHELYEKSLTGIVEDGMIREISGELWGERKPTGRQFRAADVKFIPPCWPSKIVCVGRNYLGHISEMGSVQPKEPLIFMKPPSAIIAPEDTILMPPSSQRVDYEGELAVVIGRRLSHPGAHEDMTPYIAGYTCIDDVTARDLQKLDVQFTRAKGFDTFCPFGPILQTDRPGPHATVETYVNGKKKQSAALELMIFSVDVILRWTAQVMTLEPGDLIATGTPEGVGPLAPGDVVEVRITGIGTLRNKVEGPRA
jgi:2-keto-4-pentenoate hydratase/2-oxohepta-3-ene-1,7-dioic acid hydratase in catechol pathway